MVDMKEKVYLFKVSLNMGCGEKIKKVYREMALKGTSSLYEFAETIIDAFNFDLDHAFGFYSDNTYHPVEAYTLFHDLEHIESEPNEQSVKKSYIQNVFEPRKKLHFLFDYGFEWKFLVRCCRIMEAEDGESYPKVTKKVGEAPPQYDYPGDG